MAFHRDSLSELQARVKIHRTEKGYTTDLSTLVHGLTEEAGEAAKAFNTFHNPLYKPSGKRPASSIDDLPHELCDVMVYLLAISQTLNIDFGETFEAFLSGKEAIKSQLEASASQARSRACERGFHYECDADGRPFQFCPDCGKRLEDAF